MSEERKKEADIDQAAKEIARKVGEIDRRTIEQDEQIIFGNGQ